MMILAIDSSTPVAGVSILNEEKIWAESFLNVGYTHSELLMPMIEEVFQKAKLKAKDIDAIAVTKGPGSFTGLRIGMVTGKTLAQVLDKKLIAIPTLDMLASNLWGYANLICPILNARKNQVYTALYRWQDKEIIKESEYLALSPEELAQIIKDKGEEVAFIGDGVPIYRQILEEKLGTQALWPPLNHLLPRASALGYLALKKLEQGLEDELYQLSPLYLRKSEAEIRWEESECRP